jgi:tetratricopeptide (TPR) repeat protein
MSLGERRIERLVERGREAASRGDWQDSHELLSEADADRSLSGADLAFWGDVAYAAGHLDVTIDVWERAYSENVRAGDDLSAAGAAVRVAMYLLFDTALLAPVRGWLKRADRLLDGHQESPAHAWLAVVRNYERLLAGDFESARLWAARAILVGSIADPAAAAIGRVAEARSLILEGHVDEGLSMLDEAGVAAVSGELDPLSTGIVYCELVCALQGLAQYDLAEEWTAAMERWRRVSGIGSIPGRCRVHRAEILRLRGSCNEAEEEALLACEELRPYLRRELGWPLTELGRIRLQKGDLDGAEEAFLAAREAGWDPQPGLSLVRLERGDVAGAAAGLRDALERPLNVPSKELPPNTDLRKAPLLAAQVEVETVAGDLERARSAAADLDRIAATFESKALRASAALARGTVRLADGDPAMATTHLEEAVDLWNEVGAPYETAVARLRLGEAYRTQGYGDRARREVEAARSALSRVGSVQSSRRLGDVPEPAIPQHDVVAGASLSREGDYWTVVFAGRSVRIRDLKGMRYLARLVVEPGREFHVLDLVAGERAGPVRPRRPHDHDLSISDVGDAGEMLDDRAKEAYRRRLAEIEEDIDEAQGMGDPERVARAEVERDLLVRELSRAVGLGGRDRRAGSASERARVSVTRAIRHAIGRIGEHHPPLADHLDRAVRTGTYCAYVSEPRGGIDWKS